jgi:hypothetical protein
MRNDKVEMMDTNARAKKVALLAYELGKAGAWENWKEYGTPGNPFDIFYIKAFVNADEEYQSRAEELLDKLLA